MKIGAQQVWMCFEYAGIDERGISAALMHRACVYTIKMRNIECSIN